MCLPPNKQSDSTRSSGRSTMFMTFAMGAVMMLACAAPAVIGALGGALAVGTLGLAGGVLAIVLCLAAPAGLLLWRNARVKGVHRDSQLGS